MIDIQTQTDRRTDERIQPTNILERSSIFTSNRQAETDRQGSKHNLHPPSVTEVIAQHIARSRPWLAIYYSSHEQVTAVWPTSTNEVFFMSVHPSISYFDFSGQTAAPIRLKFGSNVPLLTDNRNCKARSGHMSSSRSKKIFFSKPTSECYQIQVTTLGQGPDVKFRKLCRSRDRKSRKFLPKSSSPDPRVRMLPNANTIFNSREGRCHLSPIIASNQAWRGILTLLLRHPAKTLFCNAHRFSVV